MAKKNIAYKTFNELFEAAIHWGVVSASDFEDLDPKFKEYQKTSLKLYWIAI